MRDSPVVVGIGTIAISTAIGDRVGRRRPTIVVIVVVRCSIAATR